MLGAWISNETPVYGGMHHQPRRLVRSGARVPFGPSADRLTNLEGLGNLSALASDEMFGVDEEQEAAAAAAESDTDWIDLVRALAAPIATVGVEVVKGQFSQKKAAQGLPMTQIMQMLGMADQRAAAVKSGTASMPTAGWIGFGVGVIALLGVLVMAMRKG